MKYFKKFLIVCVLALFGVSFCSADTTPDYIVPTFVGNFKTVSWTSSTNQLNSVISQMTSSSDSIVKGGYSICVNDYYYHSGINYDLYLYRCTAQQTATTNLANVTRCSLLKTIVNTGSTSDILNGNLNCYSLNTGYYYISRGTHTGSVSTISFQYGIISRSILSGIFETTCPSCPACEEQYTSLQCQTEYNLIPVESVTANYCTANFDLISPSDCPVSSGTGDTQRSALYLNNVQYAGASNIFLNVSDFLDYSTTYIDSGTSFVLDVDGYVADTGYLNDILTVQEYHPNSEDFTTAFVSVLTLGLPYIVVALFVLLIWKLIRKIFKS